jgi:predicted kinase
MAGLPATGKSTVANALASTLPGIVLDKDRARAALFPASEIEYSVSQDDLVMDILRQVTAYILQRDRSKHVLIDGRPFAKRYQLEPWRALAAEIGVPVRVIECACTDETAQRRLASAAARGDHVATNRDYGMYLRLKASSEAIAGPKLVLDTELGLAQSVRTALAYLSEAERGSAAVYRT